MWINFGKTFTKTDGVIVRVVKTGAVKTVIQLETRHFCTYVYCLIFLKIVLRNFVLRCEVKLNDM